VLSVWSDQEQECLYPVVFNNQKHCLLNHHIQSLEADYVLLVEHHQGHVCLCEKCAVGLTKCPVCRQNGNSIPFFNP
jgi:pyrrolidone-carboxylate peptidase